ncbi:MAG: tetratricopeptide repeat protein [Candidatus Lokiarchaeota archaeon]|nr:tetratricopeptide repeat protein [Candidatus Lokiarchaeota archaeon]
MKTFDLKSDLTEIQNFYRQIIEEILLSSPEALELLKNLFVINTDIETNIDRKSVNSSYKLSNLEKAFNELLDTRIIKEKEGKEEIYEFSFPQIQNILEILADETCHERALQYYETKRKKFRADILDDIEVLFHKAKLNPTEELVNEFLTIANNIEQFEFRHKRMIDVGEILFILEDKYKAPILIVLGNILSVLGNSETAERIYLNALDIYQNLAKKYYRIYLPYIAATQKNLGTLYIDLKRFEEAEQIYSDALSSYKELKRQYYDAHSPDFHSKEYIGLDKSYIDDLKAYNELLKRHFDIYLPEEPSITSEFGNVGIDLDLIEDIQNGSIDSIDSYKKLAKISYDMYLIDIAKTQSNLGLVYSELMKFEDAERMHLKALKIKKKIAEHYPNQVLPELVLTLLDLGDLYATLNKFEDAEPMFNEALKISKQLAEENPDVYLYNVAIIQNSLGTIYSRLQRFEQAEQKYLDALKIFKIFAKEDPKTYSYNVADVQNNLGNIFLNLRNLEKAEYYLNKAIKKDPTNSEIMYNIACLESLKNNQVKALELLTKAFEIDKNYIEKASVDKRFDNIKDLKEFKELIGE